jgi:hypothetical protein
MRRINRYIPVRIQNYFHEKKEDFQNQEEFKMWESGGCPVPPPHSAKQKVIEKYAKQYSCSTLIETGTYLGDTIYSQRDNFSNIISIELSSRLYKAARIRFKKYPHIRICFGNSGELLPEIMTGIKNRCLIWLDGHYSGGLTARGDTESPVYKELVAIFKNNDPLHVILIDDARLFIGKRDYPTIDQLEAYVKELNSSYSLVTESDIIVFAIPENHQ